MSYSPRRRSPPPRARARSRSRSRSRPPRSRSPRRPSHPEPAQPISERPPSPSPRPASSQVEVTKKDDSLPSPASPVPAKDEDIHMLDPPAAPNKAEASQSSHLPSPIQPTPRPSTPREPRQREPPTGSGTEPPRQPRMHRGRGDFRGGRGGPFRGTGAEPPRGPRSLRPPSTMTGTATHPIDTGVSSQSPASASHPGAYSGSAPSTPSQPAVVPPTVIEIEVPPYDQLFQPSPVAKQSKNLQTMLDNQMKEMFNIQREYKVVYRAQRRALHEFDLATVDLKASEVRRKVTSTQLALASMGTLGVDYVPQS
ncbi:hypothetical protein PQX77_014639 [Marasmius sp. AFHP31]|nr:hypothetical protein PQX77_019075 [Marasmius sp. AFHP31]KAK1222525.1 hypothetical protein PQX77_014639 [Marasmius sp. AFHP31]